MKIPGGRPSPVVYREITLRIPEDWYDLLRGMTDVLNTQNSLTGKPILSLTEVAARCLQVGFTTLGRVGKAGRERNGHEAEGTPGSGEGGSPGGEDREHRDPGAV